MLLSIVMVTIIASEFLACPLVYRPSLHSPVLGNYMAAPLSGFKVVVGSLLPRQEVLATGRQDRTVNDLLYLPTGGVAEGAR